MSGSLYKPSGGTHVNRMNYHLLSILYTTSRFISLTVTAPVFLVSPFLSLSFQGCQLPDNLVAVNNLAATTPKADLILVVVPHQFVLSVCNLMKGFVKPTARAISLVKGLGVEDGNPVLYTSVISDTLRIPCSILSGANVANDIAREEFSESTLGYTDAEKETACVWCQLLDTSYFKVRTEITLITATTTSLVVNCICICIC